jgi:uncharacterized membrane-anchored protein
VEARFFASQIEMTEESMSPKSEVIEDDQPEVVNLIDSQADLIEADLVRTSRSYVGSLHAEEVELHQAIAMDVDAQNLNANMSAIGVAQSTSVSSTNSLLVAARAERLEIRNSLTGGFFADNTILGEGSQTGILVTGKASGEQIRTVVLVARQVEGPVETMLDTRQVALASVLTGVACGVVILMGQFLFRRKR